MPGGPLSALHGEDIVPIINNIRKENDHLFSTVVQVRDIHCPDDVAFASQHPGTKPFQTITLYYNKKGKIPLMLRHINTWLAQFLLCFQWILLHEPTGISFVT